MTTQNIRSIDSRCIMVVLKQAGHWFPRPGTVSKMTADKAIGYLEFILKDHPTIDHGDFGKAIQLGIEALKRCKERADRFPNMPHLRLPGEDSK